jgi:hypothetical protein
MNDLLQKMPAFFPFVSSEIFFDSEAKSSDIETLDTEIEAELDSLLAVQNDEHSAAAA